MSGISGKPTQRPFGISRLIGIIAITLAIVLLGILLGLQGIRWPRPMPTSVACINNLRQLGLCLRMYAEEHEGRYPPTQRWCDVLVGEYGEHEDLNKVFRCPGDQEGPCSYAMNPNADPNGSGDVVLLFESKPGWNQFGGSELLTTENHRGQGCSVLFVDGSTQFVKAEELDELKWGDGENAEGKLANVPGSSEGAR